MTEHEAIKADATTGSLIGWTIALVGISIKLRLERDGLELPQLQQPATMLIFIGSAIGCIFPALYFLLESRRVVPEPRGSVSKSSPRQDGDFLGETYSYLAR